MCQNSFDRAIITANQCLKSSMIMDAKEAIKFAQRYSDNLIQNTIIIADIQIQIKNKEK